MSIWIRAKSDTGLAKVLEDIIGPNARYKSRKHRRLGELKSALCRPVIRAVQHHFETDMLGQWRFGTTAAP